MSQELGDRGAAMLFGLRASWRAIAAEASALLEDGWQLEAESLHERGVVA